MQNRQLQERLGDGEEAKQVWVVPLHSTLPKEPTSARKCLVLVKSWPRLPAGAAAASFPKAAKK